MLLAFAGEAAEVTLRARSIVRGPLVRLGDISDIADADPGIVRQLGGLPLFPAPAADKQRLISRQEVQQLLVMHEISLRAVKLAGADEVSVSSTRQAERPTVKPVVRSLPGPEAAPSEAPANTVQVAVAIRPLRMGETLKPGDIELRTVAATAPVGPEPPKVEDLVGKELKRGLGAGQPIARELLQTPRLVHRGDLVTVRSIAPGIVVTARGRASEEGGRGDLVTVELTDSREKILARVSDRQAVEVYAGSATYETQAAGK
jgi:flagella basal body P-ring formation protein FlgA